MSKKKSTRLLAYKVTSKNNPDKGLLVFARRHSRAKSLGLKHFPGEKYQDMRAVRESITYDWHAQEHGAAAVITSNGQLPEGVEYYRPAPEEQAKRKASGLFDRIITRLFGSSD